LFLSGVAPGAEQARAELGRRDAGALWRIEFVRLLSGGGEAPLTISLAEADRALLQDLDWIAQLAGLPAQATMLTSGQDPQRPVEAAVTLRGSPGPETRWTLRRHARPDAWELTLTAERGTARLSWEQGSAPLLEAGSETIPLPVPDMLAWDVRRQLQDFLDAARAGRPARPWLDVVKFGETGAGARRSLARKRTVDLHFEEAGERSQFKSQMTAIGCGALLWTLLGSIGLLIAVGVLDPRDREYRASASAGFVIENREFEREGAELTPMGQEHLQHIAGQWSSTSPVLLVESLTGNDEQSRRRGEAVAAALERSGVREPGRRMVVRTLQGRWFTAAVWTAWGAVLAPLLGVLLLQLLIVAARPGAAAHGGGTPRPGRSPVS
jgi:hypothetical protein